MTSSSCSRCVNWSSSSTKSRSEMTAGCALKPSLRMANMTSTMYCTRLSSVASCSSARRRSKMAAHTHRGKGPLAGPSQHDTESMAVRCTFIKQIRQNKHDKKVYIYIYKLRRDHDRNTAVGRIKSGEIGSLAGLSQDYRESMVVIYIYMYIYIYMGHSTEFDIRMCCFLKCE